MSHLLQGDVAFLMAEEIVHSLEMIDIQKADGGFFLASVEPFSTMDELFVQGVSVIEPCQRVDESLFTEAFSQLVDHRDVSSAHEHHQCQGQTHSNRDGDVQSGKTLYGHKKKPGSGHQIAQLLSNSEQKVQGERVAPEGRCQTHLLKADTDRYKHQNIEAFLRNDQGTSARSAIAV